MPSWWWGTKIRPKIEPDFDRSTEKKADNEDQKNNDHDYDTENVPLPKVAYLFWWLWLFRGSLGRAKIHLPETIDKYMLKMRCGGGRVDLKSEDRKANQTETQNTREVRKGPGWRQAKKSCWKPAEIRIWRFSVVPLMTIKRLSPASIITLCKIRQINGWVPVKWEWKDRKKLRIWSERSADRIQTNARPD